MNSWPFSDDPEDDALLAEASEQVGGALPHRGRIEFHREPMVDRGSRRLGVRERVFQLQPLLIGTPSHLANALVQGLRGALDDLLVENEDIHDCVYMSDRLRNAYDRWQLTASEWRTQGLRADLLLNNLNQMLNSNEQFETDDSFTLSFVHVLRPPVGTGWKRAYMPGHQASTRLKEFKRYVVTVPQDDAQLCAPRAIVVARGLHIAGKDDNQRKKWTRSNQNTHRRDQAARALQGEVRLRPRAYGPNELTLLATAPSLRGYRIIVVDANRVYACFAYGTGPTLLGLLQEDGHYDALNSLPAFFGKSHFCGQCLKPYNDQGKHACPANRTNHCGSCLQDGWPDHAEAYCHYLDPSVSCRHCRRIFYGPVCLDAHRLRSISGRLVGHDQPSFCVRCSTDVTRFETILVVTWSAAAVKKSWRWPLINVISK